MLNVYEFVDTADYADIIRAAEARGYVRSAVAAQRETETGSVGQFGLTLEEAVQYLRLVARDQQF